MDIKEMVQKAISKVDEPWLISKLQEIVRIPSFCGEEKTLAEHLGKIMDSFGMEVWLEEVEPGRPNAIGRLNGRGTGKSFMFNGHMDHNMVCDGWAKDPFGAEIENGWLYGLGTGNMKSGDAAYLGAVKAIRDAGLTLDGDLWITYVVGELQGGKGTKHFLGKGIRADSFIDGEPTEMRLLVAHAGVVQFEMITHGQMRHFCSAGGVNHAIENMVRIVQAIGKSYQTIPSGGWLNYAPDSQLEGIPTFNLGVIRGGITKEFHEWRPSLVPDYCRAILDFRFGPDQTIQGVQRDLESLIERVKREGEPFDCEVKALDSAQHISMPPFRVALSEPIVQSVIAAHRDLTGQEPEFGGRSRFAGSDAAHMALAGMKGLLYGPSGDSTSTPWERVRIADYILAAKVYTRSAIEMTMLPK
jgi:acetylornithine deacetylase